MTNAELDHQAKIIWDYMLLHQPLQPADAIFVLGSLDTRVADYAAKLFLRGLAPLMIFSGSGKGRLTEHLFNKSEAETLADIARKAGVPDKNILIENQATNTGENIRFTYQLLQQRGQTIKSLILVQKPYMERRTYATFKAQWPEPTTRICVTSPPIAFGDYFDDINTKQHVREALVGDLQRVKLYAAQGHQIPQTIPPEVWAAYEHLVAAGYTKRLLPSEAV